MANKLIGTNANQVPSNADLGTAAYMDKKEFLTSRGSSLSEVDKIIDSTARAVFIYDTRNDSDGGAWRKRTQNTSWYNEELNTNVRGSKREFPQVAVIVCTQQTTTIYDGDDPDLPMWMHFTGNHMLQAVTGSYPRTDIHALNGIMVGTAYTYGMAHVNFILDKGDIYWNSGTRRQSSKGISERNTSQAYINTSEYGTMNSADGRGVDMKVLPDTPVDDEMGLPRPTIAIANGYELHRVNWKGYLSGRRSDNFGSTRPYSSVAIMGNDMLGYNVNNGTTQRFVGAASRNSDYGIGEVVKYNYTINQGHGNNTNISAVLRANSDANHPTPIGKNGFITTGVLGASLFRDGEDMFVVQNTQTIKDHHVSYITHEYNTGCMWGDIRCGTLMDTDASDLNQHTTQLVTDPGFEGAANWTTIQPSATATRTTAAARDGSYGMTLTSTGGSNVYSARQITGLIVGEQYHFSVDYDNRNHQTGIVLNTAWANSGTTIVGSNALPATASGTWETLAGSFIATTTSVWLNIYAQGTIYLDNLHLYKGVNDRSLVQKSLAPYGNIRRQAVAPGAELVSYGNFSSPGGNYLELKNSSNLQFGSDPFYMSVWFKTSHTSTNYEGLVFFNTPGATSGNGFQLMLNPSGQMYWFVYGSTADVSNNTNATYNDGEWHQVVCIVKPDCNAVYIDGRRISHVTTNAGSVSNSDATLVLGKWNGNNTSSYYFRGELALFNIGAGVPSGKQIEEMYDRDKLLFRKNAKCTLYGNSSNVIACSHDEGTGKTYIGTDESVSVFQDLVRVGYTEGGVTNAISAVNNMVIEE